MKLELLRQNFVNEILLKRLFKEQREKNKYEIVNVFPINVLTSLYFS